MSGSYAIRRAIAAMRLSSADDAARLPRRASPARLMALTLGACAALLILVALGASSGLRSSPAGGPAPARAALAAPGAVLATPAPPWADPAAHLAQRCTVAMLQGTCRVPRDPHAPPPPAASRVFIAGLGEVDAAVYADLQRQGDAMCGAVEQGCRQDWDGAACRIARALYPAEAS